MAGRWWLSSPLVPKTTQQRFLVNKGSSYSIIPHWSQEQTSGPRLCTAERSPISCWDDRKLHVAASGRRFTWPFLLADEALPIIRANFLRHFGLLVDLGEMRLLARNGSWSQQLVAPSGSGRCGCRPTPSAAQCEARRGGSGCRCFNFTSHGGGTLFSFTSHSGGTREQPFASARARRVPQCAQHL